MAQEVIDLEMLLQVPSVDPEGGFEISPDGKHAAFSWNPTGRWEIYEIGLDPPGEPGKVSSGPGGKFSPRYAPGGGFLAYVQDLDGGENFDVILWDRESGSQVNLTPETPDAIQPNLSWSPDGRQIAFISNRSGQFDTYVLDLESKTTRLVLNTPHPDWDVRWSPDGLWLAVVAETRGQDYGTYLVSLENGEIRTITWDGAMLNARDARWSPDGSQLAFCSDLHGQYEIGIYTLTSGEISWITSGKGDKRAPDWSPGGEQLVYVISEGPLSQLAIQAIDQSRPVTYRIEPGVHAAPHFTPDGKRVLLLFDNPRLPDDLWQLEVSAGTFRQLTNSLPAGLRESRFNMPVTVTYPGLDGVEVPALLFLPPGRGANPPGVVVIHGGPNWLYQFAWNPFMQHLASRGWVVLAPNYRGSTGYGREWQLASRFDLGGVDTADVVAGADYLVRAGLVDPARLAVTGRSHGGYLTMTSLTQYPDRWVAGSAVVPFLNWFTGHANSRADLQHWDIENFGDPSENYDLWHDRSPYFFLDRLQAPVQLICGANDPRCPASESTSARDELIRLGKQVDFTLYPDEGHAFLKIENLVDSELRRVAFLAQVLDPITATPQ